MLEFLYLDKIFIKLIIEICFLLMSLRLAVDANTISNFLTAYETFLYIFAF